MICLQNKILLLLLLLYTQNGLGTGETDDYSPYFQLPGRGITGWSEVGRSGWTVPKGGNVFYERCKYYMGTTSDCNVPNNFDPDGRGTSIRAVNERITERSTEYGAEG